MHNSIGSNVQNINPGDIGNNVVNKVKKVGVATITVIGTTAIVVNAATSIRRQDQSDHTLRTQARRDVSRKELGRKEYLEVSSLTNESKEEAQDFLKEEGQLTPTERIEDTFRLKGPFEMEFPCNIPGITNNKRRLINDSKKESNGTSPINGEVKTPSQSQQENSDGSAPINGKVTTPAKVSRLRVPVTDLSNIGEVERDIYNHYSSGSSVASVSPSEESTQGSMLMQTGPPTEVFSVRGPVPIWSDITLYFVVIASTYIFVIPLVEKATIFVRKRLNLLGPANLTDDSDVFVTPCINNLNEKILINPVKIISRYNEKT